MTTHPPKVLAVIPAYREEKTVGRVVSAIKEQGIEVLVVDDGSPDGTREAAEKAGATVLRLPVRLGYGAALQTGYIYSLENKYDTLVQLDADGQHDPTDAKALLGPILAGEADVVLGSRFLNSTTYRVPLARRVGQRIFGTLARILTREAISDPTTGYQALSSKVVRLYCTRLFPDDYPDADMLVVAHRMGYRIREVPVKMFPSENASMHSGITSPLYYVYKMSLAILMALLRDISERENT